jgi:glycosyltransferase involved in cell wall biosynthesis
MNSRTVFIIPVFNHGAAVGEVVRRALSTGRPVIVVDDGSADETAEVLRALDGITVLTHEVNQGKGAALMTGFAAAKERADWAITVDADGQHDPVHAERLLAFVEDGARAIVVGVREGMAGPETPWTSRWGRGFSNFWVWLSGGPRVADSQSGFRLYPLPEVLALDCRARRYQFEVEVLVRARWSGLDVREATVPVVYPPRDERISHFHPWLDFWRNTVTFSGLIARRVLPSSRRRARGKE